MILTYSEFENLISHDELTLEDDNIINELNTMINFLNYRKRERRIDITDVINSLHNAYTNEKIKNIMCGEVLSKKHNYVDSNDNDNILKAYLSFEYNLFDTYVPKSYKYEYESPYLLIKLFTNYIEINLYRENRKNTATFRNIKVIGYCSDTQTTVVYQHKNFNE